MVQFFHHLVEETGGDASVLRYLAKQNLQPRDVFIVFQENPMGYMIYPSPEEFFLANENQPNQHFHEVLTDGPQKIRIDIDALACDIARVIPVECKENYIPMALRPHIKSENKIFQCICEAIVSSLCNTYLHYFGEDPEICLCESIDPLGKKYSRHLIVVGAGVSSSLQAREFCKQMMMGIPKNYRDFIDKGVYKRTQNFRLVGSTKYGENRVKVVKTAHHPIDTILRVQSEEIMPDITSENEHTVVSTEKISEVLKICENVGLMKHHTPRKSQCGNILLFNRTASSRCDICKKNHDRDHTLMVTSTVRPDGTVDVYQKCRRNPDTSIMIGSFVTDEIVDGDMPVTARAKEAKRLTATIEDAPDSLETDLFSGCEGVVYDEPTLRDFGTRDTIVVHAAMKMGKTKKLREHITKFYPVNPLRPPIIRFISFRQTFADNIKENFPDFKLYRDVPTSEPLAHARLIIQVESLHRLEIEGEPPDLLILDECESIIEQFDSGLLRLFSVAVSKFIYLLKYSKSVICMDANVTSRTEHVLREIRQRPIFYHHNIHKNATTDSVFVTTNKNQWVALVDHCIAQGEKCAIPMTSLEEATALHRMIKARHPTVGSILYSSETPQAIKREHFADVNKHWSQYSVVIYTPTVSAGVSFEAKHFDKVFAFFTDNSCNDTTCIQMLGRIRDIGTKQTYICINARGGHDLPTTIDEIRHQFYGRRQMLFVDSGYNGMYAEYNADGEIVYHTTPYFHIWLENTRSRNLSRNNFTQRLLTMIRGTGAFIEAVTDDVFEFMTDIDINSEAGANVICELQNVYAGERKEAKYEKNAAIANAEEIEYDSAMAICTDMLHQKDVTADQIQQYKKYNLRDTYQYHEKIDEKFVATYSDPSVRQQYKNVCAIGEGTDEDLELIRKREKAAYQTNMANDDSLHYQDIHRKYLFNKHRLAMKLVRACGWDSFSRTPKWIHANSLAKIVSEDPAAIKSLLNATVQEFEMAQVYISDDAANITHTLLTTTAKVLKTMYGASIVSDSTDCDMKMLKLSGLFTYNPKNLDLPLVRSEATTIEEYEDEEDVEEYDDEYDDEYDGEYV